MTWNIVYIGKQKDQPSEGRIGDFNKNNPWIAYCE